MTDLEPTEEGNEKPVEQETPLSSESTDTVISESKPKARSRKKAQPAEADEPAVEEPIIDSPATGSAAGEDVREAAQEATIGSEPLPALPLDSSDPGASSGPPTVSPPPEPLSESEERTFAMIAHLSILLNLVTGFLGPVAALVIYFIYKDRSRYVRYHAMQSFVFQLIWWLGAGLLAGITWTISGILAVILIGCLLMPFALVFSLIPLAALVYGVIGAIQTNERQDFRYWLIGDWVRGELTGD